MDYSSEDDSDISESEIEDYAQKPYEQIKAGKYKVKSPNGSLRCPFCAGKKKQDYKYKELYQHASGVGKGSANRSAKQKANHLALAKYMEIDLASEAEQIQALDHLPQPVNQPLPQDELYVWPWMGIIVNVVNKSDDSSYWLKEFARYKPVDARIILNEGGPISQAVMHFNNDWNGFMNASEFEKSFETTHHGKKDWNSRKLQAGSNVYGWVARKEDYECEGPMGEYLREKGKLRTVTAIVQEASESRNSIVANLAIQIDETNENLNKMQYKYNEKNMSLSRMLEDKDRLHSAFVEESRNMQRRARDEVRRILEEQENLSSELEEKKRKLDSWSRDLNKREVLTDQERQKLEEDRRKREKEEALQKIIQLEKQLDAKQKLEMEIEELKGKLQVMKHLGDEDDAAVQNKMKEMNDELLDKQDNLENMELMNNTLITKERESNDELQKARKELIAGLSELLNGPRTNIGLKRMGELDNKVFVDACKKKYPLEEAGTKGAELCSLWQENVKNSAWHPFKVVKVNDEHKEIIDEGDEKLHGLKQEWGDEIYSTVVTALKELKEYNPSGGYTVNELWNFKEKRKATLKEVISYIVEHIRPLKRRRT
ncbi:hypothetical protein TanjilG_08336 [Lupinus angustifolius]|uniref:Factor of DNA methylation 1-5/IDN2 domain-containing protein n=1 Tax=Lupinus angustifolius TaxID=3871 RepID=A0A1J7HVV2_LUPAN|nr:hypothetical protein TanjilG_08336 [Lupinus angustifolius]